MILFSRVRGSFREITSREWALLSLETLGILAGILIAFQLNEWAARRNEAARHQLLMERLHEESETAVGLLRSFRDNLEGMVQKEQTFAVSLARGGCPADKDFGALNTLLVMPAMTVPTTVYDELSGAGGLSSIERDDVRDKVAQFYGYLAWAQQQVSYFRAARVKVLEEDDPRVRVHFDPALEEPEVWSFNGRALCSDQGFKNRVASATRAHTWILGYFQASLENAISMCVRLGDSLGRTCEPPLGGPLMDADAKYSARVMTEMAKDKARLRSR